MTKRKLDWGDLPPCVPAREYWVTDGPDGKPAFVTLYDCTARDDEMIRRARQELVGQ